MYRKCPVEIITPLIQNIKQRVEKIITNDPTSCGYDEDHLLFNPLRLMQKVIAELIQTCIELLDNEKLKVLLSNVSSVKYPTYVVTAIKNSRKKMEDRHICINDFSKLYSLEVVFFF